MVWRRLTPSAGCGSSAKLGMILGLNSDQDVGAKILEVKENGPFARVASTWSRSPFHFHLIEELSQGHCLFRTIMSGVYVLCDANVKAVGIEKDLTNKTGCARDILVNGSP